ncbi:hypothetical protein L1887_35559 [Cichorium endivia]|nr:hypothetical protein L1887_35559 [Cichorium endivia]
MPPFHIIDLLLVLILIPFSPPSNKGGPGGNASPSDQGGPGGNPDNAPPPPADDAKKGENTSDGSGDQDHPILGEILMS